MKKIPLLFVISFCLRAMMYAQYSPIVYGTSLADDYTTVNRKYFTVPTAALNDGQAHLISVMELSREMARAAASVGIYSTPATSITPATYAPATLTNPNFSGNFVPPSPRFRITKVHYSPVPCNGRNLRLIVVRPNDNVIRPCIMISHGKGGDMGSYFQYLYNGADYLMRGYVVAFYENSEALGVQQNPSLDCASPFWPTVQQSIYRGFQYAVAATKYMKGNAAFYGVNPNQFFATGVSFGSICSMMLAFADNGNFNHPIFNEPGGGVNFNAKTFPIYQGQIVTDIQAVAPIATGIPQPGTGNYIGDIFDVGDNGTHAIFIHGGMETLFKLATTSAPYLPITDFPAGCTQAGVKVETPLALRNRMSAVGITGKAVIHCDADHGTITFAQFIDANFFADPFLSNIDFDVAPNSTFLSKNEEWFAMLYMISQTGTYSDVISQQFRSKITAYVPLRPSSPDGVDGVRPMHPTFTWLFPFTANGVLVSSNCNYNDGAVAFKEMDALSSTELANGFMLSPNPAQGLVTLEFQHAFENDLSVEVLNLQGVRVCQAILSKGNSFVLLDLQQLPAGIYFVRVLYANGQSMTRKLIKE